MKLRITKSILWFLVGTGLTVLVMRLIHGPGSVTALTDIIPWGLWKGGGVVALVAIGGAGFALAMFVYVFGWKKYEPVVRGAVLLAILCYSSVGFGLTIDIGIWWRIVFPVFHWQFHSVLFEVAWCIMLYLGVLFFEFSHNVTEKFGWHRLSSLLHKLTIGFVITGISLSTLHQSSLGTLFLATPFRLHPLWHTDLLPILFFVSSIGIGCLTISIVTLLVHRLYNADPPMAAISGLGRIAAWVMGAYLALKLGEVLVAGEGALLLTPSWDTINFWLELLLSAILPIVLLSFSRYRSSPTAMLWIGIMATVGLSLNRVNVAGLATLSTTHATYIPSWTEWAVTLGVLSAAALVYLFAVEFFGLFHGVSKDGSRSSYPPGQLDHTDGSALYFSGQRLGEARVYSLLFMIGIATSFGCLSNDAVFGVSPQATQTQPPLVVKRPVDVPPSEYPENTALAYLELDGNRDGRGVLFSHDAHAYRVRENGYECSSCHHMNRPQEKATTCAACHKDVYLPADIFDHELHKERLGQNAGCAECHVDSSKPKTRNTAKPCQTCHESMRAPDSFVQRTAASPGDFAASYMDAMHGLCVNCHEKEAEMPETRDDLGLCATCHTESTATTGRRERRSPPTKVSQ
jgi:Ni/Fe-hydrogenase subunit HybB-like protein